MLFLAQFRTEIFEVLKSCLRFRLARGTLLHPPSQVSNLLIPLTLLFMHCSCRFSLSKPAVRLSSKWEYVSPCFIVCVGTFLPYMDTAVKADQVSAVEMPPALVLKFVRPAVPSRYALHSNAGVLLQGTGLQRAKPSHITNHAA